MVAAGHRAVMLYLIQIGSATRFALAATSNRTMARRSSAPAGVEAMAWKCMITMDGIEIATPVPIVG